MGHAYLLFTLILYNVSKRRNHVFKKEMIAKASDFFTRRGYVLKLVLHDLVALKKSLLRSDNGSQVTTAGTRILYWDKSIVRVKHRHIWHWP